MSFPIKITIRNIMQPKIRNYITSANSYGLEESSYFFSKENDKDFESESASDNYSASSCTTDISAMKHTLSESTLAKLDGDGSETTGGSTATGTNPSPGKDDKNINMRSSHEHVEQGFQYHHSPPNNVHAGGGMYSPLPPTPYGAPQNPYSSGASSARSLNDSHHPHYPPPHYHPHHHHPHHPPPGYFHHHPHNHYPYPPPPGPRTQNYILYGIVAIAVASMVHISRGGMMVAPNTHSMYIHSNPDNSGMAMSKNSNNNMPSTSFNGQQSWLRPSDGTYSMGEGKEDNGIDGNNDDMYFDPNQGNVGGTYYRKGPNHNNAAPIMDSSGNMINMNEGNNGINNMVQSENSNAVFNANQQLEVIGQELANQQEMSFTNSAISGGLAIGVTAPDYEGEMEKSKQYPLTELSNFKDNWDEWEKSDVPVFLHIPKAGGSTVKDIIGTCHRFVMATETGITDGHADDQDIAVVYPAGGPKGQDRSPFVNVDTTTVAGITRAKSMGFADSGLADAVVTPFIYESNDLFTPTAKGRLFTVFRHPIDRAISMFYYIQVADWEPTYDPELKDWTIEQYATSNKIENNWLTRQLSNQPGGDLTDENLSLAMEVIRRKFMVGLMTDIETTMERFERFFRWTYHVNPPNQEKCREALLSGGSNSNSQNKRSEVLPGSKEWELLAWQNKYDLALFEYIEALFAEQEQFVTEIPVGFRNIDATCCKCGPPTFPPEGFDCPLAILN